MLKSRSTTCMLAQSTHPSPPIEVCSRKTMIFKLIYWRPLGHKYLCMTNLLIDVPGIPLENKGSIWALHRFTTTAGARELFAPV